MDNRPTEAEYAREVFRRGLDLMGLDADVEQIVLADVERFFKDAGDETVWAFAA